MGEYTSTVPFTKSIAITPSDTEDLREEISPGVFVPIPSRSLYVETGGTIRFATINDTEDTMVVPDAFILPGQIKKIFDTGTTASGIHVLI